MEFVGFIVNLISSPTGFYPVGSAGFALPKLVGPGKIFPGFALG